MRKMQRYPNESSLKCPVQALDAAHYLLRVGSDLWAMMLYIGLPLGVSTEGPCGSR